MDGMKTGTLLIKYNSNIEKTPKISVLSKGTKTSSSQMGITKSNKDTKNHKLHIVHMDPTILAAMGIIKNLFSWLIEKLKTFLRVKKFLSK